jgi:very-short-patch-repair endonuclease
LFPLWSITPDNSPSRDACAGNRPPPSACCGGLLRDRRLEGLKFRRQVPLGRYVADFLCLRHRLVVEADGPHHEDGLHDETRDAWLRAQGFRVLRFINRRIQDGPDAVLTEILRACGR